MPLLENFIQNLRSRLIVLGESKTAVAERAGIHRVTLHKILAGEFEPSLEMCERLASALEFSPPESIFEKNRSRAKKTG